MLVDVYTEVYDETGSAYTSKESFHISMDNYKEVVDMLSKLDVDND